MNISSRQISILWIIHGVLAFSLPFIVLFLTSCLEADENPRPFGPVESVQGVNDALNASFASLNVENIFKDEFVHVETSQQVFGGTKFVTKDTGITVIDRSETADRITLTLAIEEYEYDGDGNVEHVIFEDSVAIRKASAAGAALKALGNPAMLENAGEKVRAMAESIGVCEPTDHPSVTFHNLKVENTVEPPPSKVLDSEFCKSDDCQINVSKVSFDQVFWDGDSGTKIKCAYIYSSQVPYLASQMKFCMTLVVPSGERSLLLTECREVMNFAKGIP